MNKAIVIALVSVITILGCSRGQQVDLTNNQRLRRTVEEVLERDAARGHADLFKTLDEIHDEMGNEEFVREVMRIAEQHAERDFSAGVGVYTMLCRYVPGETTATNWLEFAQKYGERDSSQESPGSDSPKPPLTTGRYP